MPIPHQFQHAYSSVVPAHGAPVSSTHAVLQATSAEVASHIPQHDVHSTERAHRAVDIHWFPYYARPGSQLTTISELF